MQRQADIWKAALISGAIFGFLSGVPILNFLNCLCCSFIMGAGVLSAYMVVKGSIEPVTYGRAALAGLISGVIAAPVSQVPALLLALMQGKSPADQFEDAVGQVSQFSSEGERVAEMIAQIGLPVLMAVVLVVLVVVYGAFGTIGGVIGRAIFEKRMPAPPTPPASMTGFDPFGTPGPGGGSGPAPPHS